PRDKRTKRGGISQIPPLDFVLFRIQILFAAWLARLVFAQFECRSINSVTRSQSGCKYKPCHKSGPPALLEGFVENVWSIRPETGPKEFPDFRLGQLGQVLPELVRTVTPCEVSV